MGRREVGLGGGGLSGDREGRRMGRMGEEGAVGALKAVCLEQDK